MSEENNKSNSFRKKNRLVFILGVGFFICATFFSYLYTVNIEIQKTQTEAAKNLKSLSDQLDDFTSAFDRGSKLLSSVHFESLLSEEKESSSQSFILKSFLKENESFISSVMFNDKSNRWYKLELSKLNYLNVTTVSNDIVSNLLKDKKDQLVQLKFESVDNKKQQILINIDRISYLNDFLKKSIVSDSKILSLIKNQLNSQSMILLAGACKGSVIENQIASSLLTQNLLAKIETEMNCLNNKSQIIGAIYPIMFFNEEFGILVGVDKISVHQGVRALAFILGTLVAIFLGLTSIFYSNLIKDEEKYYAERELMNLTMHNNSRLSLIGEMAAGIAHEINSPLQIVLNSASILRRDLETKNIDTEKIVKNLNRIETTTNRISKIVKGLRIYSRNSELDHYSRIEVNKVVEEIIDLASEKLLSNEVKVTLNRNEINTSAFAIETQIGQVILNIINNAIDAMENITHDKRQLEVTISSDEQFTYISIANSGDPIADHIKDKIMNPFFTTKEIGKGTGLGLSISHGVILKHKGKLFLDEKALKTTFVIALPILKDQKIPVAV